MMDMAVNKLKQALAAKSRQLGCWLTLESTIATEITAGAGFDWLLLDNRITDYGAKYMQSLCVIAQVESPLALSAIRSMGQVSRRSDELLAKFTSLPGLGDRV